MIDLNKLQQEIDDLFESETDESILNWYMTRKFSSHNSLLGKGHFYNIDEKYLNTIQNIESAFSSNVSTNEISANFVDMNYSPCYFEAA